VAQQGRHDLSPKAAGQTDLGKSGAGCTLQLWLQRWLRQASRKRSRSPHLAWNGQAKAATLEAQGQASLLPGRHCAARGSGRQMGGRRRRGQRL
jgi:hypothetical protein